MESSSVILLIFLVMLVLLFLGVHVAVALGLAGIIGTFLIFGYNPFVIGNTMWVVNNSYTLAVIPLFVFMGYMLLNSGISKLLFEGAAAIIGWLPGELCCINVFGSAIFAGCTGSSIATITALGTITLPEGKARGYNLGFLLGTIASSAVLGPIIPPSVMMVLYGVLAEESIGRLFISGIIPGITIAAVFLIYVIVRCTINPALAPRRKQALSGKERILLSAKILPFISLIGMVLGFMYAGICTPTESAAIGAAGSIVISIAFGRFSWKGLKDAAVSTTHLTCMIMFILIGATMIAACTSASGVTDRLIAGIDKLGVSPAMFFAFVIVLYLIMGMFLDSISILVLTVPLIAPIARGMGFDLVWLGLQLTILIEIGVITPPFGINLFALAGIVGQEHFLEIAKGCIPFELLLLLVILMVYLFPGMALWLPSLMM